MAKAAGLFILIALLVCGIYFFYSPRHLTPPEKIAAEETLSAEKQTKVASDTSEVPAATEADPPPQAGEDQEQVVELTEANFEAEIEKCFSVQACTLSEDAWRMYQEFKTHRDPKTVTQLIAYLKMQLRDPEWREAYGEDTKKMIDDFYPPNEKDLQDAEYFADIGEPQKSLDIYLDLQQRAVSDPSLKKPPNAALANTLYDLNRYEDALIYYQMALNDVETGKQGAKSEERTQFLQTRIDEIKQKLGPEQEDDEE